jgi:hypothetical protein
MGESVTSKDHAPDADIADAPAYEMVERPELTVEQRLAFYATYREIGGSPIEELEALQRETASEAA